MPYVPPGGATIQPIAIPIGKTHQLAEGSLSPLSYGKHQLRDREDVPTPKASDSSGPIAIPSPLSYAFDAEPRDEGADLDALSSALHSASLSVSSIASTPPLEHSNSGRSGHQSSPAASSVVSLPSQRDDYDHEHERERNDAFHTSGSGSDLQVGEDVEEQKHSVREETTSAAVEALSNEVLDALSLYREKLYAYTHTLYIQAKLSSSRAERRRQSISTHDQLGAKQSGMEKMAAKKALARRLNG